MTTNIIHVLCCDELYTVHKCLGLKYQIEFY